MIFCHMMNNNNNATLSYTISDTFVSGIMTFVCFFIFVPCIRYGELDGWQLLLISGGCLWSLIETLRCFIIDITYTFDNEGFVVNKLNRFTSNVRNRKYKWNKEFTRLAQYYSGREDIIDNKSGVRWKRKPFEKDW